MARKVTTDFVPPTFEPEEEANLELIATNKQDLQQACKEFGDVDIPVSPEKSYARGEGLKKATVGEQEVVVVTTMSTTNREYIHQTNFTAEMVHCKSGSITHTKVQYQQNSEYRITYKPTKRGKHQLSVKINGSDIKDSPFTIAVISSPQSFGRPVRVIRDLKDSLSHSLTANDQNQLIWAKSYSHCVDVFSPEGKKIHSFGSKGSDDGQLQNPSSVTVDNVGNIYVVDHSNHRIQKFTSDGKFIQAVGTQGSGPLQFDYPLGILFNEKNRKIYICDQCNHRIQVLNTDLTFHSTFGQKGRGDSGLEFENTLDIALNSRGEIYVTDHNNRRVQVFTEDGTFLRTLSDKQQGETIKCPCNIAIDSNDTVYVSERDSHCISVFTAEGEYLTSFGEKGDEEGQFKWPAGLHIDKNDYLFVHDKGNFRIQIF